MNPQDRPKAIVLLVLVVAVFGFVIMRFMGSKGAPTPEQPVATSAPTTQAPGQPAAGGPGPAPSSGNIREPLSDEELAELDSSNVAAIPATGKVNPFRRTVREVGSATGAITGSPGSMPGEFGPLVVTGIPTDPMALVSIELVGVVVGTPSYAVLRAGDEMVYLRKGEHLSEQIVLQDVRSEHVVLRYQKNNYRLVIGEPRQLEEGLELAPTQGANPAENRPTQGNPGSNPLPAVN